MPVGGGPETFDQLEYYAINHARLAHLESLQFSLEGKAVLDVGCGVGHLAQFFVKRGCKVVCIDARKENIDSLRLRYPDLVAKVASVETESLSQLGMFDIVFCYGLLYHLENPTMALRNMASVCQGLLLLETIVCDHALPVLRIEDESAAFSQAMRGLGCRPSPSYVVLTLNRVGFRFVYAPKVPPQHQEFRFECKNNLDWQRDGHPLRCIFVASRTQLQNPHLVSLCED
jgi:SAM-dependent methyltransferase